jgi:arylsulfatase A
MNIHLLSGLLCISLVSSLWGEKENVILIVIADGSQAHLSCYRPQATPTPNIDALAKQGILLENMYAGGIMSSEGRAAILTGIHPLRLGISGSLTQNNQTAKGIPVETATLAKSFKDAGYATALFGKWHLGYLSPYLPTDQGFDEFRGHLAGNIDYHSHINGGVEDWWNGKKRENEKGYAVYIETAHAERFIRTHQDTPFFINLNYTATHGMRQGPDDPPYRGNPEASTMEPPRVRDEGYVAFAKMMKAVDDGVGKLVDALRETGLNHKTTIVITGDAPWHVPPKDFPFVLSRKHPVSEGFLKVPFIVWSPQRIKPGRSTQLCLHTDIFPTLIDWCGLRIPSQTFDGITLEQWGTKPLAQKRLFEFTWHRGSLWAVRKGPWKLVTGLKKDPDLLFNIEKDPTESIDLIDDEPDIYRQLKAVLKKWDQEAP